MGRHFFDKVASYIYILHVSQIVCLAHVIGLELQSVDILKEKTILRKIFGPKMQNSAQFYFALYQHQPMWARMDHG